MRDRASAPAHGDGTAAGSGAASRPGTSDVAPAAWHGTGPVDGGPPTSTAALLLVAAQGGGAAGVAYNVYTRIRLIRTSIGTLDSGRGGRTLHVRGSQSV